jgi:hypothetical protein
MLSRLNKKALPVFALYLGVVGFSAAMLIRAVGLEVSDAEADVPVRPERAAMRCAELAKTLENELFAWHMDALKALPDDALRPTAMPGPLREWESARRQGEARCPSDHKKFRALLNVRRGLEGNRFLLARKISSDVAELRQ